jgi:hypothetical protein
MPSTTPDTLKEKHLQHLRAHIARLVKRSNGPSLALLRLLREYDLTRGWREGFASCAHWLSWRTGMELALAQECLRVAHGLARRPEIAARMRRGALSYGKVKEKILAPARRRGLKRRWTSLGRGLRPPVRLPLAAFPTVP